MFSQRLKRLRHARGLSLEALTAKMGGIVTKQALSKYEQGKAQPSREVLNKLAGALGIKAAYLWSDSQINVSFFGYRKGATLPKRAQYHIESYVSQALEERIQLQDFMQQHTEHEVPVRKIPIKAIEDVELAAKTLRKRWHLGLDPIANVVDVLEGHGVHVLGIEANEKFDGIAATATDRDQSLKAAAVVTRRGVPGERQRLSLCHELGHLVLDIAEELDLEKVVYRFGAAFLAPEEIVRQDIGVRRSYIQVEEFLMLKKRFGMSIQALLFRLRDLDIINESYYKQWWIHINRLGWKKREPLEMTTEEPQWLRQNLLHALSEKVITHEEAEQMLGESMTMEQPLSLIGRQEFMRLPLEERRRILTEQARKTVKYYQQSGVDEELQGGDIVEY